MKLTRRTLLASSGMVCAVPALGKLPATHYRNPSAPTAVRVMDLLGRMTLDEKVAQLCCLWAGKTTIMNLTTGAFAADKAATAIPHGIGQIARPSDMFGTNVSVAKPLRNPEDVVNFINALQRFAVEQTRLGIPVLFHEETAHGLMVKGATSFPIPTALGSSFDPELVEEIFTLVSRQARMRGITIGLSPVVDLIRDPRWGRAGEFFGEDPFLVGQMGLATVRGLQGRARPIAPDRIFATLKHFIHGAPQGGINIAPADMSERTLRETYLPPFAKAVEDGHAAIIMPSYNEVGGVPSHSNHALLQQTGRDLIGFRGLYLSDYGAIEELATIHHVAADRKGAAVLAMRAGVDVDLPDGLCYKLLGELVQAGRVPIASVDAAVARVLALKFEAGLFEAPYVDGERAARVLADPAGAALARVAAHKALVLLKNDGVLPLDPAKPTKIALIGPNALKPMLGGYARTPDGAVGILEGLRAGVGPHIAIEQADGVWITQPSSNPRPETAPLRLVPPAENQPRIAEAVVVAKRSDVIVLVLGDNDQITREAVVSILAGDRMSLGLFGDQDALVEAMLATGKPVIALLLNGRPLAVNRLAESANALVEGWYLGDQGGHAFTDMLFGRINPGGKLSVSFPRSVGELPVWYDRHSSADVYPYVEGKHLPLFPFGHGLSYTRFSLSEPRLSNARIGRKEHVTVNVTVANTGPRDGDEVVQIYVRDMVSSVPRPILELKAFRRVTIAKGETQTVSFDLGPDAFGLWDADMQWSVEPGDFRISAGNSSAVLKHTMLTID